MGGDDELTFGQKAGRRWAGFKKFLYNTEAGTVMGRNGKGWAQLLAFYTVFYACLAAFWAAMLTVFLQTIDHGEPTWNSYISTPALAFSPVFKFEKIAYSLPWEENSKIAKKITDPLNAIWATLDPAKQTDLVDCPDTVNEGTEQRFCRYNRSLLGDECIPPSFGYDVGRPCIFVNLNKVWGWKPEAYEEGETPEGVEVTDSHITFQCTGEDPEDNDVLNGTTFYPETGISFGHYPYIVGTNKTEQKMFINPILAIQFHFYELNKKVRITCKPFARNLVPIRGIYNSHEPTEFTVEFTISEM